MPSHAAEWTLERRAKDARTLHHQIAHTLDELSETLARLGRRNDTQFRACMAAVDALAGDNQ